jgi:Na+/melibiose symporter-like transporter
MPISVMIGIPFWSFISVKYGQKMNLMIGGYILVICSFIGIWLMPARRTIIVSAPFFFIGQFLAV